MHVATFFINFGACINVIFIIKVKIILLINDHVGQTPPPPAQLPDYVDYNV